MNGLKRLPGRLWGLYSLLCFALACLFSLLVALLVPGKERRQRLVTWAARMIFRLAAIRVSVCRAQALPPGSCVIVANHASFIDGILLKAYLPARFGFVIKGEMRNIPVVHFLLRRSGSYFVDRNEGAASSRDARTLVKAARGGKSLGFFPEGTFRHGPGVARFRGGAFVAAIKGELPVVPIAVSGTRDMLPAGHWLPRRAELTIDILPMISPGGGDFTSSRKLAEVSRQHIIAALDEPDLA